MWCNWLTRVIWDDYLLFESDIFDDKQLKVVKRFGVKLKSRLCACAYQSIDLDKNLSGHA